MKQKPDKIDYQSGFTLIELLVVLAMMSMMMGALVIDFASQRGPRNLTLAKNETVTNLRKAQSYMLSSKATPAGLPVRYYIVNLNSTSTSYQIQAIDSNYNIVNIENIIKIPSPIFIQSTRIANITYGCVQIVFSAPFGQVYVRGGANGTCTAANIAATLRDPVLRASLSQSNARIYFAYPSSPAGQESYVEVVPATGQMSTY